MNTGGERRQRCGGEDKPNVQKQTVCPMAANQHVR